MKLTDKYIYIIIKKNLARKGFLPILCLALSLPLLTACKDDMTISEEGSHNSGSSELVAIDLPGVFAVNFVENDPTASTNQEVSSDHNPFSDGDEYDLADVEESDVEKYHYLLLFEKNGDNKVPSAIFPLENPTSNWQSPSADNITATVSKVYSSPELESLTNQEFNDKSQLASYMDDKEAYILLNFKITSDNTTGTTFTGNSTVDKLAHLTKSDLRNLLMTDYKVKGKKTTKYTDSEGNIVNTTTVEKDFYTMTNSVYSSGTAKVVDSEIDTSKIYTSQEAAVKNPAISVHMERLASKLTLSFNPIRMAEGNFGPTTGDSFSKTVTINEKGLPIIETQVNKVNMIDYPNGIEFTTAGYEIKKDPVNATITILGFGLSNLESSMKLFKNINSTYSTSWAWNDPDHYRSYWAQDEHYELVHSSAEPFTKVNGYPHQFRKALDTDSVTSYHIAQGGYEYEGPQYDKYKIQTGKDNDGNPVYTEYTAYNQLGDIQLDQNIKEQCYLNYKSYRALQDEFDNKKWNPSKTSSNGRVSLVTFDPFYTLENTYYDPGMLTEVANTWRWPWHRVPYATATNLLVLAQIVIHGNAGANGGAMEGDDAVRTVYLGQNNIFYLRKVNFLKSKLAILNQVMLSGGNAGIQILHGQWDQHLRWTEGDENQNKDTHLDKVAWNEGSVLWFAEVDYDENTKVVKTDKDGNIILKDQWQVSINNDIKVSDEEEQDLDLISAEISGGDGQCLIAPSKKRMGAKYRYYLAPPVNKVDADGNIVKDEQGNDVKIMDEKLKVEISYNHLVSLIHKIIGPVDVYTNGLMYFSVPIPHRILRYGNNINTDAWAHLGSFSVVRNNWYNISVTQISRLGTPVHDLNQPIIPVMDVKRSYINMGVELLDYHEINQGDIPVM